MLKFLINTYPDTFTHHYTPLKSPHFEFKPKLQTNFFSFYDFKIILQGDKIKSSIFDQLNEIDFLNKTFWRKLN